MGRRCVTGYRGWVLGVLLLASSSCGYHLRGTGSSAAELSGIDFSIQSMLEENQLERILARQWALLVSGSDKSKPKQQRWQLTLLKESQTSRGVMRGVDGRANQYELTLQIEYQWQDLTAATPRTPEKMQLTRSYYQPSSDLVGNQAQQVTLLRQMREELAERLLHQLASLGGHAETIH